MFDWLKKKREAEERKRRQFGDGSLDMTNPVDPLDPLSPLSPMNSVFDSQAPSYSHDSSPSSYDSGSYDSGDSGSFDSGGGDSGGGGASGDF